LNDRPTVRMDAISPRTKVDVIKAWSSIITAVLAFAGMVFVAILNHDDVDQDQLDLSQKKMDSIEIQVENHINKTFAPKIAKYFNDQKEKIVRLETMNGIFKEEISRLRDRVNQLSSGRRRFVSELHERTAPPKPKRLKTKEKLSFPQLDIKQQTLE